MLNCNIFSFLYAVVYPFMLYCTIAHFQCNHMLISVISSRISCSIVRRFLIGCGNVCFQSGAALWSSPSLLSVCLSVWQWGLLTQLLATLLSMSVTSKWAILLDTVSEWQLGSGFGSQLKVFWHHTVFGSSAYACCCFQSRVHTLTNTDSVSIPGDIICPQLYSSCFQHTLSLLNAPLGQLQWYFSPTSRRLMYATSWSCYNVCLAGVDREVQNE